MSPSQEIVSVPITLTPRPRQLPAQRVYVASPLTTYRTPRYDTKLAQIRERFPDATVLPARDLFRSTADWRTRWPALLPTLTQLVFFPEIDGTIGLGVWSELHDAADRLLVWYLDDAGRWFPLAAVALTTTGDSRARFATVRLVDRAGADAPFPPMARADGA